LVISYSFLGGEHPRALFATGKLLKQLIFSLAANGEFDSARAYAYVSGMAKKKDQLTTFAAKAGVSVSYASQLIGGSRQPTVEKAADIYRRTGRKFGVLAVADVREANVIVRVLERAGLLEQPVSTGA
jgi:transcriptional regulator with XRE-family HTH domain